MDVAVANPGANHVDRSALRCQNGLICGTLPWGEPAADRPGPGDIGGIAGRRLGPAIKQHELSVLQRIDVAIVVEDLSANGHDGPIGGSHAVGGDHGVEDRGDLSLVSAGTGDRHRGTVGAVGGHSSPAHLGDLFFAQQASLLDDRRNQRFVSWRAQEGGRGASEVGCGAVDGKIRYRNALDPGQALTGPFKPGHRLDLIKAQGSRAVLDGLAVTVPECIVVRGWGQEQGADTIHQEEGGIGLLAAGEVQEAAVLAEGQGVGAVAVPRAVAHQQNGGIDGGHQGRATTGLECAHTRSSRPTSASRV